MRILYHHRTRAGDAQGIHIEEILRGFRGLGHSVREVAMIPRGAGSQGAPGGSPGARTVSSLAGKLPPAGYELAEMAANVPETLAVSRAIRDFQPDLIYERYSLHNAAGVLAARRARVPLVLEVNSPLAEERAAHGGLSFPRLASRVERAIWRAATAIVAVSSVLKHRIVAAGVEPRRVLVLHNAVRRELFAHSRDGAKVRDRFGIPPTAVVCGFTGWFRPWHGLEGLLHAFADAKLATAGVRLLLVGEGRALPLLDSIARRRGLSNAVIFAGKASRADIADHLAAFDVAVQPSATPWASPMKIFEYLALGKPVVAAATPAICEALRHGHDSLLFKPGDYEGMAGSIRTLAENEGLRARLSRGARQTILERGHFWDENARRTLQHAAVCSRVEAAYTSMRDG